MGDARRRAHGAGAAEGDPGTEPLDGLWPAGALAMVGHGSGAVASDPDRLLHNRGVDTVLCAEVPTDACVPVAGGFGLGYR